MVSFFAYPVPGAEIALITDASNLALGAVLQQKIKNDWLLIFFYSHCLTDPQSKFSAFDRELLAVFMAVKHFDHFLEGKPFIIFTDHKPIISAINSNNTHYYPRVSHQLSFIAEFTQLSQHIEGKNNAVADAQFRNFVNSMDLKTTVSNADFAVV